MLSHTSFIWWMRLESNQQCREAGDLQSPGVTSFPTHPYFGSPSTDRTYDIFVNSEAQLPLCYRGIDWWRLLGSNQSCPKAADLQSTASPLMLHLQLLVPRERLELSILAAVASKTTVYTIPPPGHYI